MDPFRALIPAPPPPVRVEGNTLVFLRDEKLPHVCLKCGAPGKTYRTRTLQQASAATSGIGVGGGILGTMIAQLARSDIAMALLIGGAAAVLIGVIAWLARSKAAPTSSAIVDLPLCDACDARWTAGLVARGYVLAGLGISLVLAVFGALSTLSVCYCLAAAVFIGAIVFGLSQRIPDRFITAAVVDETSVRLLNLPVAALAKVHEALTDPPQKKRKKRKPREPEIEYGPV